MKFFFFGDSICYGQLVSIHKGWVARISAKLEGLSKEIGTECLVQNSAVNGRTTRQALESMPFEIQSHSPDILLVQFGMNDCNYWETDRGNPRVSQTAFAANLDEIISRAFSFGVRKIFLNTNHRSGRTEKMPFTKKSHEESNREYNAIIRQVASAGGGNNTQRHGSNLGKRRETSA